MNRWCLIAIVVSFFFSCQKTEEENIGGVSAIMLNMSMTDYQNLTYVQSNHAWSKSDKVLIADSGQDNVSTSASPISIGNPAAVFMCNLPLSAKESTLVGIYPEDAPVKVKSGEITYNIPLEQDGTIMNLQAGCAKYNTASHQGVSLTLKPMYKVLNVWVGRSNHIIKQVKVRAKNKELIAGDIRLSVESWTPRPSSSTVTLTLDNPLDCTMSQQSVAVMVADNGVTEYIAEIIDTDGTISTTENVTEGYVADNTKTYELGISQALFGSLSSSEAKSMITAGVKHIEVTMNTFWRDKTEDECYTLARNTKKVIDGTKGLEVWSVHLPFSGSLDISVLNDTKRAENVEIMTKMIRLAGEFAPKRLVLHPSSEPISESDRAARIKCARESIAKLLPVAKETGAVLCLENLPRTCLGRTSEDMLALLEGFPEVMVCFDSNHLLIEDHNMFFNNVGHRIATTHASDYDKTDEKHWLMGLGIIDWPNFLTNLMHFDYDGVFMTEVKSGPTAAEVADAYKNVVCRTN